ncbi:hypothetical protein ARMSODRAFT_976034 [Armillaria solidipes]|uniref:Uncharacterized protein n=1 Tax=Armillaria solidipes TaxID=1076256 RepID=A0A2H3BMH5_9AGAR|nr:hypothetical protein ARMSODRAFT_976034 [Armillaria solidipes]
MFKKSSISGITLQSAGLVALADLSTVAVRTALTGTASWLDILVLAPGMHQQQSADEINRGEFPQTGSLTKGYVFRVENPATVNYLQRIGRTGYLVTAVVEPKPRSGTLKIPFLKGIDLSPQNQPFYIAGVSVALLYLLCPILTIVVFAFVGSIRDWWALAVLGMLVLSRTINVIVIKRRVSDSKNWKGADEKPDKDDLLVVLSQDRWVRLHGDLSAIKQVTAGQWLRDEDRAESLAVGFATLLVYAAAALAGNASTVGSLLIALLLLFSVALLALCNSFTHGMQMYDCVVREKKGEEKFYKRRMDMVEELILKFNSASGQGEWAVGMGLIKRDEMEGILGLNKQESHLIDSLVIAMIVATLRGWQYGGVWMETKLQFTFMFQGVDCQVLLLPLRITPQLNQDSLSHVGSNILYSTKSRNTETLVFPVFSILHPSPIEAYIIAHLQTPTQFASFEVLPSPVADNDSATGTENDHSSHEDLRDF